MSDEGDDAVRLMRVLRAALAGHPSRAALVALMCVTNECALLLGQNRARVVGTMLADETDLVDAKEAWSLAQASIAPAAVN